LQTIYIWVATLLNEDGCNGKEGKPLEDEPDFKMKERVIARDINATTESGVIRKKKGSCPTLVEHLINTQPKFQNIYHKSDNNIVHDN
jgi:hypothetical protein